MQAPDSQPHHSRLGDLGQVLGAESLCPNLPGLIPSSVKRDDANHHLRPEVGAGEMFSQRRAQRGHSVAVTVGTGAGDCRPRRRADGA